MNQYTAQPDDAKKRLDVFVVEHLPELSRAFVQKLIRRDTVLVNGAPTKHGHKLRDGDVINVEYSSVSQEKIPKINLPVLYEDDDCLVINKPTGVLTHSKGAFNPEATVATWLQSRIAGDWRLGTGDYQSERTGIVHRLDRATSGVIIAAKTNEALAWLQKQFSTRKVKKVYMAVVAGELNPSEAGIDMPIERNPKKPQTFRAGGNGRVAITLYKTIMSNGRYTLVRLLPQTGRTHQLRVHMKQIGHPIVGDSLYGGEVADRLYLHALSLELTLPSRGRKVFTAPLPTSFKQFMDTA